jgi:hypothetical protein
MAVNGIITIVAPIADESANIIAISDMFNRSSHQYNTLINIYQINTIVDQALQAFSDQYIHQYIFLHRYAIHSNYLTIRCLVYSLLPRVRWTNDRTSVYALGVRRQ